MKSRKASGMISPFGVPPTTSTPSKTLLWGATGEQDWTPQLTTGMFLSFYINFLSGITLKFTKTCHCEKKSFTECKRCYLKTIIN